MALPINFDPAVILSPVGAKVPSVDRSGQPGVLSINRIIPRLKQRPAIRIVDGRFAATRTIVHANGPGETYHAVFELAAAPDAVWVIYGNGGAATYQPGMTKVSAVSADDLNGATAAWTTAAAYNPTVPASPSTYTPGLAITGVAKVANPGRSKLLAVRCRIDTTVDTTITVMGNGVDGANTDYTNWVSRDGHKVLFRNQAGNRVTDPSLFTSTDNVSYSPIIGVMYTSNERVYTCMCVGDSTESGQGTYKGSGPIYEAFRVNNNSGQLWEVANLAWSGTGSIRFTPTINSAIGAGLIPDMLVKAIGSPNDVSTITTGQVQLWRDYMAEAAAICNTNSVYLIPRTMQPANSSIDTPAGAENYGATDALRVAINADFLSHYQSCFDYSTPVSGPVNANGQIPFAAGMTTDAIHQNDLGIAAQAADILARMPFLL